MAEIEPIGPLAVALQNFYVTLCITWQHIFQYNYFVITQVPKDPVKDEKTVTIQRVLDQERQFYKVNSQNNIIVLSVLSLAIFLLKMLSSVTSHC